MNTLCGQNWKKFKAEDLQFVAYYPQEPKRSVEKIPSATGEIDMHMVMYLPTTEDDNVLYSVVRSDYPKEQFENTNEAYNDSVLTTFINDSVEGAEGKVIYDNKIKFNGYQGRSVKVKMQGGLMYLNAYLVENTIFITQVVCLDDKDKNVSIQRFLNSFEIIKTK